MHVYSIAIFPSFIHNFIKFEHRLPREFPVYKYLVLDTCVMSWRKE